MRTIEQLLWLYNLNCLHLFLCAENFMTLRKCTCMYMHYPTTKRILSHKQLTLKQPFIHTTNTWNTLQSNWFSLHWHYPQPTWSEQLPSDHSKSLRATKIQVLWQDHTGSKHVLCSTAKQGRAWVQTEAPRGGLSETVQRRQATDRVSLLHTHSLQVQAE